MGKTMLVKEKEEAVQFRVKESLRILREKELQAKSEQEAKAVKSNTYLNKEKAITNAGSSGHLNTTYTKPEATNVTNVKTDSYEMTPAQPQRSSLSLNNYDIDDMQSDDSTDDDVSPEKKIPQWAMKTQMRAALFQQEHYPPKRDNIFPPTSVLVLPDLSQIFPKQKRRFRKRTSSAIWETPPLKFFRCRKPRGYVG